MKRALVFATTLVGFSIFVGCGGGGGDTEDGPIHGTVQRPEKGSCKLDDPAFCETFDEPSPGGRGGDLDETAWSVARISNEVNRGQGNIMDWAPTTTSACGETTTGVLPGDDMFICTNPLTNKRQFNDSFSDGETPSLHSMRVRQPIDFTDRTSRIAIDIDAKEQTPGGHGWWWELVISEEPVPAPYQDLVSHFLYVKNALVLEFQGLDCTALLGGDRGGDGSLNALSRIVVEEDYRITQDYVYEAIEGLECFKTEDEVLNHLEVRLSRDSVEVWVSDLDDMSTFRMVGRVDGLDLKFTRGYVNLQHSHYNAPKGGLDAFTTYHVGSIGFDGPSLPRPRAYEVPDAMAAPGNAPEDHVNLGYYLAVEGGGGIATCCDDEGVGTFAFEDVDLSHAASARINLNTCAFIEGRSILYRFNGGQWRTFAHPFPDSEWGTRAVTIPVDVADLSAGKNTLELKSDGEVSLGDEITIANVELEVVPE